MPLIISDVRTMCPEFADSVAYPDALIDGYIQQAIRATSPEHFGSRIDDARLWLTAHLLTVSSPARGGGLTSVGGGSVSLGFSAPERGGGIQASLDATLYGQRYRDLVRLGGGMRYAPPATGAAPDINADGGDVQTSS